MKRELCEFAQEKKKGWNEFLWCTKTNSYCAFQRWCPNDFCVKHTNSYKDCREKNENKGD